MAWRPIRPCGRYDEPPDPSGNRAVPAVDRASLDGRSGGLAASEPSQGDTATASRGIEGRKQTFPLPLFIPKRTFRRARRGDRCRPSRTILAADAYVRLTWTLRIPSSGKNFFYRLIARASFRRRPSSRSSPASRLRTETVVTLSTIMREKMARTPIRYRAGAKLPRHGEVQGHGVKDILDEGGEPGPKRRGIERGRWSRGSYRCL